ncbi:hypothetical protein ACJX0J_022828, partial [Zea mays]
MVIDRVLKKLLFSWVSLFQSPDEEMKKIVLKVGVADIVGRIVEDLKDESEPYRRMTSDDANVMLNGFGAVVNALGQRQLMGHLGVVLMLLHLPTLLEDIQLSIMQLKSIIEPTSCDFLFFNEYIQLHAVTKMAMSHQSIGMGLSIDTTAQVAGGVPAEGGAEESDMNFYYGLLGTLQTPLLCISSFLSVL